jgi:copper chaperone CopZ
MLDDAVNKPSQGVAGDRFVLIRIEGMHCHKCEQSIKKLLQRKPGVHEVEVDFASGQASVLFDPAAMTVGELIDAVKEAGYKPTGFTQQSHADSAS